MDLNNIVYFSLNCWIMLIGAGRRVMLNAYIVIFSITSREHTTFKGSWVVIRLGKLSQDRKNRNEIYETEIRIRKSDIDLKSNLIRSKISRTKILTRK